MARKDVYVCDGCGIEAPTRYPPPPGGEGPRWSGLGRPAQPLPPEGWLLVIEEIGRLPHTLHSWACLGAWAPDAAVRFAPPPPPPPPVLPP